jgi:hypothetical protein
MVINHKNIQDDNIGCIGFDTLGIVSEEKKCEQRIYNMIEKLVSILLNGCKEFRLFLLHKGLMQYISLNTRGVITITIHENDFKCLYNHIKKCRRIFIDPNYKNISNYNRIQLIEKCFTSIGYYSINDKHLKTINNIKIYNEYDPNQECMLFIGICSNMSPYLYRYLNIVRL